ncbi:tRNA lysidine(34) synthetase TilS [Siccirubricoccus phaeus]|uniref:tRNA lysidine(34) synthetase TilS n=1 Tax=Siccirubricoccus phaeus TaxID=2595053 RepID=UPI0011F1D9EF|nr:tRNA lysidine(34) synthetase TilS [Siccirubricoccus phaeus]
MPDPAPVGAPVSPAVSAEEFAALMTPLGPFGAPPRLAAGVSGGPHSLALALLAEAWARARGGDLLALVVDHGLRPESAAEAEAVLATLAARGIAGRRLRLGLAPGPGMQERARQARLAALLAACRAEGRPWLLLGHHLADQAETVLFRALRGSGPAGLAGMAPARPAAEALLLRPLLGTPPARLEAVVAAAGLAPVRDPSNRDPRFARPRLRAALADPGGEGAATAALAAAAAAFARRRRRLAGAVAQRLAAAAALQPEGHAELDLAALGQDAVAVAALGRLLALVSGRPYAPPESALAALLRRGEGTLGGAWLRPRASRPALLAREAAGLAPPVPAARGAVWDGRFRLIGPGDPECALGALGPAAAARLRGRAPHLPAAVLATLPAIWRHARLVAVPLLHYPAPEVSSRFATLLAPAVAGDL